MKFSTVKPNMWTSYSLDSPYLPDLSDSEMQDKEVAHDEDYSKETTELTARVLKAMDECKGYENLAKAGNEIIRSRLKKPILEEESPEADIGYYNYELAKKEDVTPISIEIEDGECNIKINGRYVGFCKRIELKAEANKPVELVIERLAYNPQTQFMEDIEEVRGHLGHLKLILDYYGTLEMSANYFKKE